MKMKDPMVTKQGKTMISKTLVVILLELNSYML